MVDTPGYADLNWLQAIRGHRQQHAGYVEEALLRLLIVICMRIGQSLWWQMCR